MVAIKSHNRNLFALDKHGEVLEMDSTGIFRVISKKDLFWNIIDSNKLSLVELEEVRILKNYKIGWLLHKLNSLEEYKEYGKMKNYKENWANYQFKKFR